MKKNKDFALPNKIKKIKFTESIRISSDQWKPTYVEVIETNEAMRKAADSPMRKAIEMNETMRKAARSPMRKAIEMNETMRKAAGSPMREAIEMNEAMRLAIDSPMRKAIEMNEIMRKAAGSPMREAIEMNEAMRLAIDSPMRKAVEMNEAMRKAADSPMWKAIEMNQSLLKAVNSPVWIQAIEGQKKSLLHWSLAESAYKWISGIQNMERVIPDTFLRDDILKASNNLSSSYLKAINSLQDRLNTLPGKVEIVRSDTDETLEEEANIELILDDPNTDTERRLPFKEIPSAFSILDLLKEMKSEEVLDFVSHLYRYPMLALEHEIGRVIRERIKDMSRKVHVKTELFRCRKHIPNKMPYIEAEMWAPPNGVSSQGRFNVTGNPVLYTSEDQEAALFEMKEEPGTQLDVMRLSIDAEIEVIEITGDDSELFRYCMFPVSGNSKHHKEYLIPNFIAQCCQITGIHAIKYKSVIKKNAANIVFFDYLQSWFEFHSNTVIEVPFFEPTE